tara:strand:+ start:1751 stop:1876 length:126 start_codon:yes stop_codon:yes gene_type:complete
MTDNNDFNEKIANEDSKLDSYMSVLLILAVTGIIVFWVATQ